MNCRRTGLTALLMFSLARTAAGGAQETAGQGSASPAVEVNKLGVSVDRIGRQLRRQATVREERNGLNLEYFVDVYGQAPRIEIFPKKDNLLSGPVPYGGPTHRDILQVVTPQEFRSPPADFSNLLRWFSDRAKDKK
jgi:hypothetical protein